MSFSPCTPRRDRRAAGAVSIAAAAALVMAGCSPPPPAEEPTGSAAERAWTIAVGDHELDQTIANVYALALTSRDSPTVVESRDSGPAQMIEEGEADLVLARTMALARQLDEEGWADLDQPSAADLVALISGGLGPDSELLEPSNAVLDSALVITSVTAEEQEISTDGEVDVPEFADACDELRIGVRPDLPDPAPLLAEVYDCEPEAISVAGEEDLVRQVITADLDAVILTASHPSIQEQALVALTDAERAFPQEQFVPVVSTEVAEEAPEVTLELAEALDDDALVTLRRLTDGDHGLSPQEAAEYWLVQEGFVAEPEDWG